jgi:hypothetical protein
MNWLTGHSGKLTGLAGHGMKAQIADHKTAQANRLHRSPSWQTGPTKPVHGTAGIIPDRVHAALVQEGKASPAGLLGEKDKKEIVLEWLSDPSSPGRMNLSIRDIQRLLPDIGVNTIQRALVTLRTGDR